MKLSIAMMVKNEEKHLKECLEGLNKLREQVDSELIIVDTGSTDNTVNIAKEYTDKVYFHKWNNNFSEMRNITVNYCKGEWFFYIDGDEVMQNPQHMIEFFKSNLYKEYNSATVKIRNFMKSKNEKACAVFTAARLFKKDKDFHFEGAVHNQPVVKMPIYNINTEFLHYGYINDDKELMERKFKRTAGILKKELKKDPNNIYYLFQLSISYSMHKDNKESLETITKAYNLVKERENKREYLYVYMQLIKAYMSNEKYDLALKICKETYEIDKECIDNLSYMGTCYIKNHEYNNGIECYKKHIELLKTYDANKDLSMVYYTTNKKNYELNEIARIYNMLGKSDKALEYLNKIDDKEELSECYIVNIPIYIKNEMLEKIYDSYEYMKSKNKNETGFLNVLEKVIQTLDDEKKKEVYKLFSKNEDEYGVLNKIRTDTDSIEENLLDKINFEDREMYFADAFYYFLKQNKNISKYIFNLRENKINRFFTYIIVTYKDGKKVLNDYLESIEDLKDLKGKRIQKILMRSLLIVDYFQDDEYKEVFKKYIENGYSFLEKIYNKELLKEDNLHFLFTDEDEFMVYMNLAKECKNNDTKQYLVYLRKALKAYPTMKKGIEILKEHLEKELNPVNAEFENYKVKVKETIKNLIANNELDSAGAVIDEYEQIVKDDIEMYSIKAVICIMENKIDDAEKYLYEGLHIDKLNFDLLYNLAYLYEIKNEKELELEFYKKAINSCRIDEIVGELRNKIFTLKNDMKCSAESNIIKKQKKLFREIDNENKRNIIRTTEQLLNEKKFLEVINIFNYYLKHSNVSIGEMYYFVGRAYNALENFEKAIKYHNISIRIEPYLSNIVDKNNIILNYNFEEETSNCIGCGGVEFKIINVSNQSVSESNKGIINPIRTWVKCKKCGLVYSNPVATENRMNKYYSIISKEKFGGIYGDIKQREAFLFQMSNCRLDNISKITNEKLILDIGTGVGFFVKAALDRGFKAYGLELTKEDCEYAKNHYGLDLIRKNFYSFNENEQYDIVTMFEVIEHLRTPLKDLKRINKLVKMNGIFVIATPILDSEYGKKTKEKNVFWHVVTHLSYFTEGVLSKYLKNAGFEIISIVDSMETMGRKEFYCKKIKNL
ncbi:methyltransferase domain-containing protein [Clostridium ganghwense]|uniref:Methyltransferase domain-containing protein n=1 Tax=Clostridium ganghwense TaxID=312089 RepID=A0ABT4CMX0_9CLOT|nr:methyltransferase domain-containing protein [Clostridium ganghwense]MCY6370401.1 methyltransferase domain-containing protein [Clostridium ganghwense]